LQVRFLSALRVSANVDSTVSAGDNLSAADNIVFRRLPGAEGNQVASMVQDEPQGEIVASGGAREKKLNVFSRFALFIRQVFAELRKVVTPTRQELIRYTLVVLAFVAVMMSIVYGLDVLFVWLAQYVFGVPPTV
jgi:preprotein translocase subunit SecE